MTAKALLSGLGRERPLPRHIAILMDGEETGAMAGEPLRAGTVSICAQASIALGISYLTLCGPAPKSGKMSGRGMGYAARLLEGFTPRDLAELKESQVRLHLLGSTEGLPSQLLSALGRAVAATCLNTGLQLTLALNYRGRAEILRGVRCLVARIEAGEATQEDITEAALTGCLDTAGFPDPDLVIVTNGGHSLGGFLLWQCAYSEFFFSEERWPDFTRQSLEKAIAAYGLRDRRFGGVLAR